MILFHPSMLLPNKTTNISFIFIPPKLGGMGGNRIRFNDFFIKTLKIPLYIQPFILK